MALTTINMPADAKATRRWCPSRARRINISLYVCVREDGEYLAEKNKERLGKVSVGRSFIRFADLEVEVAMELVRKSAALLKKGSGDFAA